MAKKLVRYLLEGNGSIPMFIDNGGHWPVGAELVGVSVDEAERHVPSTVVRMSRADLIARVVAMDLMDNETHEELDEEAKTAKAEAWLEAVGMEDLE